MSLDYTEPEVETYRIEKDPASNREHMLCLFCNHYTYNQIDVANFYCSRCKVFHLLAGFKPSEKTPMPSPRICSLFYKLREALRTRLKAKSLEKKFYCEYCREYVLLEDGDCCPQCKLVL